VKIVNLLVSPTVRTFRNTDVDSICRVWNAHFGDLGFAAQIDPLRLELCSLAKPYFREQDLLIAEEDEQVVGFLHLGQVANDQLTDAEQDAASIAALCVVPSDIEEAVAGALLNCAEAVIAGRNSSLWRYKPMLPDCSFYLGLGPADSMGGATTSERRCCGWLSAAGFLPSLPTSHWELDLTDFQPPVNRIQIQIRRSAHVERLPEEPSMPWWQACVLGHTDPSEFRLTQRSDQQMLGEALFWTVSPELQTVPESVVWMWPPSKKSEADQTVFLIGEACRQLQNERIDVVRTATAANDTATNGILQRLGFSAVQSGIVFEKKLARVAS
jgi:hypothetical protein